MDTIRNWAAMFCAASLVGAFIVFLLPEGNMKKPVQIVLSFLMLFVAVWPLSKDIDLSFPELPEEEVAEAEDCSSHLYDVLSRNGQEMIENAVSELLGEICAEPYSVQVTMKQDSDGNIILERIRIRIDREDSVRKSLIQKKVGSLTGVVPEVEVE